MIDFQNGTDAAMRKLRSVLVDTVNTFIDTDEGKVLIDQASEADYQSRLAGAEDRYLKAQEEANDALVALRNVQAERGEK